MTLYRNTSTHVIDLEGGRTVGPGEAMELSKEDLKSEHNQAMVDEGTLIVATSEEKPQKEAKA